MSRLKKQSDRMKLAVLYVAQNGPGCERASFSHEDGETVPWAELPRHVARVAAQATEHWDNFQITVRPAPDLGEGMEIKNKP